MLPSLDGYDLLFSLVCRLSGEGEGNVGSRTVRVGTWGGGGEPGHHGAITHCKRDLEGVVAPKHVYKSTDSSAHLLSMGSLFFLPLNESQA